MRSVWTTMFALLLSACAGCQKDYLARRVVEPSTQSGKILLSLAGTGEKLIEQGRIDLHREIVVPDKTVIDVWVLRARPPEQSETSQRALGTMVVLHGLSESKAAFPYFGTAQRLAKMGYDVVLPDLRAHGRSGGKYVTYGAKEKHDVKAVVDALVSAGQVSPTIYAFGVNLGGAVAIQYAAIDERCKGVMADAPYKDCASVARLGMLWLSAEEFQVVMDHIGKLGDFDPAEASTVKAAAQLKCPLLVVHGLLDMSVPMQHSEAIVAAAPEPKKFLMLVLDLEAAVMAEDWLAKNLDKLARTGLAE